MKKFIIVILSLILWCGCLKTVSFAETYSEGYYLYEIENDEVIITEYLGNEETAEIPETIAGMPVVCISDYAFRSSSVYTVIIPEFVTSVSENAFVNSKGLKNIILRSPDVTLPEMNDVTIVEQFPEYADLSIEAEETGIDKEGSRAEEKPENPSVEGTDTSEKNAEGNIASEANGSSPAEEKKEGSSEDDATEVPETISESAENGFEVLAESEDDRMGNGAAEGSENEDEKYENAEEMNSGNGEYAQNGGDAENAETTETDLSSQERNEFLSVYWVVPLLLILGGCAAGFIVYRKKKLK